MTVTGHRLGTITQQAGNKARAGGCWLTSLALLMVSLLLSVGIAGIAYYEFRYQDRFYPGVRVEPLDLSGLTMSQAHDALTLLFLETDTWWPALRYGEKVWRPAGSDLGARVDIEGTLEQAFNVGRDGDIIHCLFSRLETARYGYTIHPVIHFDRAQARRYLSTLATEIRVPVREASLRVEGTRVEITPSQVGYELDELSTLEQIEKHVLSRGGGEVSLIVRQSEPVIRSIDGLGESVRRIITGQIELLGPASSPINRWALTSEELAALLVLEQKVERDGSIAGVAGLSAQGLRQRLEAIAEELDRPAREGSIDFDQARGQLVILEPSQTGFQLDVDGAIAAIQTQAMTDDRKVVLPVAVLTPAIDTDNLASLGIVEEIVAATTYFKGSSGDRMLNIEIAATQFDGILVEPDEIFSFNKYLGEVSPEKGYAESLVIWGDRTAVGLGGGVCQVSTTVFRAAFWAGLEIIERWAHGYRVSWYEPPVGMDATVYSPVIDFKFRNDTPYYILMKTETDREAGTITFRFYGTHTGRVVEMIGPTESNVVSHPAAEYRNDPSLPAGTTKQVDWARDGVDVTVKRIVRQGGAVLYEDTIFSRYQPWKAVFLVGTGGG